MTSRQRMLIAMTNGQPDMVPVAPDTSNMIPCRLTGKPFWEVYLYQDPPRLGAPAHPLPTLRTPRWTSTRRPGARRSPAV